jgi:hypothetical protein
VKLVTFIIGLVLVVGCRNYQPPSPLDVCVEKLVECRSDLYALMEECIADQTAMGELEGCAGLDEFSRKCREEE